MTNCNRKVYQRFVLDENELKSSPDFPPLLMAILEDKLIKQGFNVIQSFKKVKGLPSEIIISCEFSSGDVFPRLDGAFQQIISGVTNELLSDYIINICYNADTCFFQNPGLRK